MFRLSINPEHRENPWWSLGGDNLWSRLVMPRGREPKPKDGEAYAKLPEATTLSGPEMTAFLKAAKKIEGWYTSSDIEDTPILIEPLARK